MEWYQSETVLGTPIPDSMGPEDLPTTTSGKGLSIIPEFGLRWVRGLRFRGW